MEVMEQRIRDIQQNLAHNAMSGEFENLQPLVDEATVSLLQLIREAQIEAVYAMHEDIIGTGRLEFKQETDQAFNYARLHNWIDNYIERLKAKEPSGEDESA